ncbi:MAG: ADOP family duplicated permease [Terriglobia bacterium]
MSIWRNLTGGLRALFHKEEVEQEMDEELRGFLDAAVKEKMRSGMSHEQARRAARLEMGSMDGVKEEIRSSGWESALETLWQDLRYAVRQLRRNPGFTAVAVITLALGIGASTAIFSVVETVLLRGTPYRNPGQLVEIVARGPKGEARLSLAEFNDWQTQRASFEDLAAYVRWEFRVLSGAGEPDEVWVSQVSTNAFHVLGVPPLMGRAFAEDETQAVIVSQGYWRSHFGGDPKILGKTLALDGKLYTVIGIAPANLEFPDPSTQMWVPLTFSAAQKANREYRALDVVARLRPGITVKQAQASADLEAHRLAAQYPKTNAGWSAIVKPFQAWEVSSDLRSALWALLGAVAFVLMIVCSNVTSMLLARGTARQGEMAVRAALGAGRWRLVRQLIVETVLLAGAAAVAGLLVAWWGLGTIVRILPRYTLIEAPVLHEVAINLPIFAFAMTLSLLTGIAVGLFPALRISRLSLNESLQERGRASGRGPKGLRLQRALIVFEVALALVLLVGAGLMIQSFQRLSAAPTGFQPDHVLTARVPLVKYKYAEGPPSAAFYQSILERIQAIPGVRSAGMVNNLPLGATTTAVDFPFPPGYVFCRSVSPGYFQAMGIAIKSGRDFTPADNQKDAPCVRIVNEAMARRYWPGENAVGKQVLRVCSNDTPALIVGVVADSQQKSVDSKVVPEMYIPYAKKPFASFLVTFVVRTSAEPMDVVAAVRHAVAEIDRDQPVIQVRTLENVVAETLWRPHLSAILMGVFAALALVLSAVGIYGVFSYSVGQRTHEIGIRSALGATRGDILRLVLEEGMILALLGVGIGTLAALGLTRLLAGLLYGIRPRDPLTFVSLSLLLAGVALFACFVPARRATKVDPMVALRYE